MKLAGAAATLLPKYRQMRELRRQAARDADAEGRAVLRAFAAAWPGGLKELDTLPGDEIERRLEACETGDDAPWMAWMARYHELARAALAIRRGEVDQAAVDAAFVQAVKKPNHGRINVAVFAQLGREFGAEPGAIWDALFPPRGKSRRDYR
ncbi:MAG: hypothetical protein JWN44_7150 [Myxococcales bacterium]|nr:hypothetical protein [Myxococcales bacterium]